MCLHDLKLYYLTLTNKFYLIYNKFKCVCCMCKCLRSKHKFNVAGYVSLYLNILFLNKSGHLSSNHMNSKTNKNKNIYFAKVNIFFLF